MDDIINTDNANEPAFDSAEARRDMRKRQLRFGLLAQEVALYGLRELKQKMAQGLPLNMTGEEAHALLELGEKMERRALRLKDEGDPPVPSHRKPS